MKVVFNFYNANRWLPEPEWIFRVVRRVDHMMGQDANKSWVQIKEWCRPMCQLPAGLFFNLTDTDIEKFEEKIKIQDTINDELKLEMIWLDSGYIRVTFDVEGEIRTTKIDSIITINFRPDALSHSPNEDTFKKRMKPISKETANDLLAHYLKHTSPDCI